MKKMEKISGLDLEIVSFEEYKKIGGMMTKEEYEKVKKASDKQEFYEKAWQVINVVRCGYPFHSEVMLLARICEVKPNLPPVTKMCEMLSIQGKK
jgi:hypothetical protein